MVVKCAAGAAGGAEVKKLRSSAARRGVVRTRPARLEVRSIHNGGRSITRDRRQEAKLRPVPSLALLRITALCGTRPAPFGAHGWTKRPSTAIELHSDLHNCLAARHPPRAPPTLRARSRSDFPDAPATQRDPSRQQQYAEFRTELALIPTYSYASGRLAHLGLRASRARPQRKFSL